MALRTPAIKGHAGQRTVHPLDAKLKTELASALRSIGRHFNVSALRDEVDDKEAIVEYYTSSSVGYSLFHSAHGSVHMALNPDGKFDKSGYYGQAELVQQYIDAEHPAAVLELACGRGFNIAYLAPSNPAINFTGVDLTPAFVREAKRAVGSFPSVSVEEGDFERLPFHSGAFDLVFVVESICHATDMHRALEEASRVLRPRGLLIVVDGFRQPDFSQLDNDVQLAARLAEVAMAVTRPWVISDWLAVARASGFTVEREIDLSDAIMPNLIRLRHLANGFFNHPAIRYAAELFFSKKLLQNAIAGRLLPLTTQAGAHTYAAVILRRSGDHRRGQVGPQDSAGG